MAANDEFPRGLTLSANGGIPSLTFPAANGVTWVLTSIYARAWYVNTYTLPASVHVSAVSGSATLLTGATLVIPAGAQFGDTDDFSWSGQIPGLPGSSLVVAFDQNYGAIGEELYATAYPV